MQVELILLVLSLLFFASIFTDKIGYKFGVPALLLFLAVGMLFGPDGIGRLINDDGVGYMLNVGSAQAIGTIALCIILFSGGLDTGSDPGYYRRTHHHARDGRSHLLCLRLATFSGQRQHRHGYAHGIHHVLHRLRFGVLHPAYQ